MLKCFTFPLFIFFLCSLSPPLSLSLSLSTLAHLSESLTATLVWTVRLDTPFSAFSHSWCCFSHCSLCSSPFPTFRPVTALTGQVLAGMIAEPAFLSEYTIFALDHSKQPKTAQVASVSTSKGPARSPRGSINGDGSASPQREETPSLAQKLQLRVPSVESLIRGGASRAESLFRSPSKENLVRSSSRDSLTPLGENESVGAPTYDPPSDIESEAEETPGSAESLSKEQLLHRLLRVERSLGNYRGKYSELVTAYRTVQREKEKTQVILSQSQDKSLRRIGELREELQMDQQAKKHLQDEFDAALEEKDQMITVLQTQVALLKKRAKGVSADAVPHEGDVPQSEDADSDSATTTQSPFKEQGAEPELTEGEGNSDPTKLMEALQKRVKRQENLLQKCKEVMRTHKERSAQLGSENETLQEQLQERLQELEKTKELHTTEKTKLITQLRDAKNLIEQLEQDKGMVIAETKRQMHETLEMKEEEVAQLRSRLQQATAQKEELQEQKEKAEKSAFEELERALGAAQRAEEARKQLQVQLEEQVKEVERASEEERKTLQQELTRVKQEVVTIMKKSSDETVAKMEKFHSDALAAKEEEISVRINKAVEQCKEEFAQLGKEREQQSSLALEDVELQKTALRTEAENKVKEIQLELEAAKTRVLELESSLEKFSQDGSSLSHELSSQLEKLKDQHKEEMSALEQRHQEELGKHKGTLTQQNNAALEELKEKHRVEVETLLEDKELQLQAHVEDMNQKTLEKLDAKQAELEAVSAELSEALKSKRLLEERLVAAGEDAHSSARQEHEKRFQDHVEKHNIELANLKREHEQSLGGLEKSLKEELNALRIVLREKEKEIEAHILREKTLQEESHSTVQQLHAKVKELETLQQCLSQSQLDIGSLKESNAQTGKMLQDLDQCKTDLEQQLEVARNDCQLKEKSLQELQHQLQQTKKELSEQEKSFTTELNTQQEEQTRLKKQLDDEKADHEKKMKNTVTEMEAKLKTQETKMEKFKHKAKEMHESYKKKLLQNEEAMKIELAKKERELQQTEQQVQEKIVEMAQKSSQGLSSAMSELLANHKEEVEKLHDTHKHEIEVLEHRWQEKLGQQEEELTEKHSHLLQEKAQELEDVSQQLSRSKEENGKVLCEINDLKEGLSIRETTVQKLQEELNEAAVKLEGLSQGEAMLKEQMESVERNLSQALKERNSLQDKLNTTKEENREKLKTMSGKLKEMEKQRKALQGSRCKESEDLQNKFEETAIQLQAKEAQFQQQLILIRNQMEYYCKEVQDKVECGSNELCQRVEGRLSELKDRLLCSQKKVVDLKNVILNKVDRICTLEENLRLQTEKNKNLCISLEQMTAQVNAHMEHVKALTHENENHSQSISEKVLKIAELSEANRLISESMKTNELHISKLESITSDLKNQLGSSIKEKEEAINQLTQQYKEDAAQMEETIKRLEQERESALEQADALRNSLSEYEKQTETKFAQNGNTITSLQTRLDELEREISEKNEALQRLTASMDNQSISKSEMDQALSEKEQKVSGLTAELESCISQLGEFQEQLALKTKECEQLTADLKQQHSIKENEKRELVEQLQQTQMQCTQNGNLEQEMVEKLHSLEEDHQKCKHKLESQRDEFERMKDEIIKSKEESLKKAEEELSAESARKVTELKKKAEQKIGQIKKQLTSQLEEKEKAIKALQSSLEEIQSNETSSKQHTEALEEKTKTLEEALVKLKAEREQQLEQILNNERLDKEKSLEELKNFYEEKLSLLMSDAAQQREHKETESALREIEAKLKEAEEHNGNLLAEINRLKEEMCEKDAQLDKQQAIIKQVQNPSELEAEMKVECSSIQQTRSAMQTEMKNHSPMQEVDGDSLESLKSNLHQVKNEKEKIYKDFARLQKDIRVLRREHEQDLEYMKKELLEENEKKLKLELEDMEMKHNSAIKQLMREFNTQMALKEKEIDTVVKETIEKAQTVEEELMSGHREETSQLRKSREEEMGGRVWQVQKELEELQAKGHDTTEMSIEDLQAQLAEKTTLLSEARLKEQGFAERIHSLEDKIKCFHRTPVVTHLGSTFKEPVYNSSEPTEMEYLRKVLFEYMMGRETKTMAKVITSMLKFPPDQAQKVLDKEDSKAVPWLR
ncbi:golgin subfamily A member 4 isoform X3 [Etheostoma cragini]|uniref:golgin subfamily A member 4 isoform X3 n=1 Tax=Etheostoma cragini TaxID=417921 RepID=UPI00155EFC8D|nr:golgin subfamily A member 4 isoform X3 [Etheostoma cragini]